MALIKGRLYTHLKWILFLILCCRSIDCDEQCTTATQGGNSNGAPCVFPFEYDNMMWYNCTELRHYQPWCATTNDYLNDQKWGNCVYDCEPPDCPVRTTDGDRCVFPFIFKGSPYYWCTNASQEGSTDVAWCATTDNYDRDGMGGQCIVQSTRNDRLCVFPFLYNGDRYSTCTNAGTQTGQLWCGVEYAVDDGDADANDWGYCNTEGICSDSTTPDPDCAGGICSDSTTPDTNCGGGICSDSTTTDVHCTGAGCQGEPVVGEDNSSLPAIIAGCVVTVLLVLIIVAIVFLIRRRKNAANNHTDVPDFYYANTTGPEDLKPTENMYVNQSYKAGPNESSYENACYDENTQGPDVRKSSTQGLVNGGP